MESEKNIFRKKIFFFFLFFFAPVNFHVVVPTPNVMSIPPQKSRLFSWRGQFSGVFLVSPLGSLVSVGPCVRGIFPSFRRFNCSAWCRSGRKTDLTARPKAGVQFKYGIYASTTTDAVVRGNDHRIGS